MMYKFMDTDEIRLRQVLVELLGCCIKLTHYGSVVLSTQIKQKSGKDFLKFAITGTGLDLSDTLVSSALDAPIRGAKDKRQPRISLFTSKRLVETFGGTFKVRSKPGKVSLIGFTIPLKVHEGDLIEFESGVKDSSSIGVMLQKPPDQPKCGCAKVLVIDPAPVNQFLVGSFLDKLKVPNKIVQDTRSALTLMEERSLQDCCQHYSLILIDSGEETECSQVLFTNLLCS